MKRITISIILLFLSLALLFLAIYAKYYYPPIPSITSVGLDGNKIIVNFDISKHNYNNEIYCLLLKSNEVVDTNDQNWKLASNNKCSFEIDKDSYTVYLKNKHNKVVKVEETSKLGEIKAISINKKKVYLPIGGTYTPTLTFDFVGNIDKNVVWKSDNSEIATVSEDGLITAKKDGKTKVSASVGDKSEVIEVISSKLIVERPKAFNSKKKYLTCNQFTKEENDLIDEILFERVDSVGRKTRAGVVEAARFITLEFPYKIRYFSENGRLTYASKIDGEGRYYHLGLYLHSSRFKNLANSSEGPQTWGCNMYSRPSRGVRRNGLDCSGFISWVVLNGGFNPGDIGAGVTGAKDFTDLGKKTRFTPELIKSGKVKVGDLLSSSGPSGGHIAVIAGETDDSYYVAESLWYNPHISVTLVKYSKKTLWKRYYWVMLMDSYYKEDGKLTKMWY